MTPVDHNPSERGVALVWLALFSLGLFGLAALVIDLGFLRLTQAQMTVGAEVAALEGLRFACDGDVARRDRAVVALRLQFDDDLDPSSDAVGFGAGPVVDFAEPRGNFSARFALASTPAGRVYKPADTFELNLDNLRHGDLVAGEFVNGTTGDREDSYFVRTDFDPTPTGSTPDAYAAAGSFLVRLRRLRTGIDRPPPPPPPDRQAGVSSAGPPLAFLFGQAGLQPSVSGYNPRIDGLGVRATSIAGRERALRVSAVPADGNGDGAVLLSPLALRVDVPTGWDAVIAGAAFDVTHDPTTGVLTANGAEVGVAVQAPVTAAGRVAIPAAGALTVTGTARTLVPVYAVVANERVVLGFTLAASLTNTGVNAARFVRDAGCTLPHGASVHGPAALDARLFFEARPTLAALRAAFTQPVFAPVLRRG